MGDDRRRSEEFDRFFRAHVGKVRAFCLRRADAVLVDDAVAETFEIAWRRWDEIPKQSSPWLLGVALRVLANRRRADRRYTSLVERLATQSTDPGDPADARPILEALSALSPNDQEALMLAAWDGLKSREAGRVLGCSPVAFRLRLHRARRRLADALGEFERRPLAEFDSDGMLIRLGETRS